MRKTGGKCPACGEVVTEHVARARLREKRIEQVVAVVATALVLALFMFSGGLGLIEGVLIYAAAGVGVWYWGKGTFWSATLQPENDDNSDDSDR